MMGSFNVPTLNKVASEWINNLNNEFIIASDKSSL